MRRSTLVALTVIVSLGVVSAEAGLWQDIYLGLNYAATPTGSPVFTTADGTQVNGARSGRVRIVPNGVVGRGYRVEFDRAFGVDSRGRPETLRFACGAELMLQGSIQATAGYTTGFNDKYKCGHAEMTVNNLHYGLRTKAGLQDVELFGTLDLINALEINPLGFYSLRLNISNTNSRLELDGLVIRDEKDINFDIGPIVVEGNIFVDATLALLTSLGVDVSELEQIFPQSPIDRIDDAIAEQLQTTVVAGELAEADLAPLLLDSVFQQDEDALQQLVEELIASSGDLTDGTAAKTGPEPGAVPEPGTLLLVLGGATLWCAKRRR
ncbi:MAG: PEP-CTERM sorting domain-containing protein [Phycisphaerae bacterium]|nr:PEP-CTERM sorting domain-containing protein [Phycisphaerae bacterium]